MAECNSRLWKAVFPPFIHTIIITYVISEAVSFFADSGTGGRVNYIQGIRLSAKQGAPPTLRVQALSTNRNSIHADSIATREIL
jgi:hypothetical protein